MFNLYFSSTNTTINRNTLNQSVFHISEHFARLGYDETPIFITDSETGELYEVLEDEKLNFNYKFHCPKFNRNYTILELLELLPYL